MRLCFDLYNIIYILLLQTLKLIKMSKEIKFSASDLTPEDMKMIQNQIIQRLVIKQGDNLSPHDSHSSSHGKNSVATKIGDVIQPQEISNVIKSKEIGK